jgi:aminocarboxymuconate-semialdehyde decarboxylase
MSEHASNSKPDLTSIVIDTHAHVFLPEVLGACGAAGPELSIDDGVQSFRAGAYTIRGVKFQNSPMSDLSQRLALMDRMGIAHQILSPYPMLYFYDQPAADCVNFCARHNDATAALVKGANGRLAGLATLPMQDPAAAVTELKRALNELDLRGACVGGRFGERELSDPTYDSLWDILEEQQLPVIVHTGPLDGGNRNFKKWDLELVVGFAMDETLAITQLVFGGVLDRHPRLTAIVPHGGGFAPYARSRFEMALSKRAWGSGLLSRPFDDIWNQMVFDCLVHDDLTLDYLVKAHGSERVVLGTNFAAWDQDDHIVDQVKSLNMSTENRDAILGINAKRIFRL